MATLRRVWHFSGYFCLLLWCVNASHPQPDYLTEDELMALLEAYHRAVNGTEQEEPLLAYFVTKSLDMFANFSGDGEVDTAVRREDNELTLSFRIVATILHAVIFVLGVVGNLMLIVVVHKSELFHNPMYTYLVSMAYADLLVCITAIPEAIVTYHLGNQWFLGQVGCSIFIFLNFFGINAGVTSMSMMTFERYVAICRPLLARKVCTVERTRKIIACSWLAAALYCSPWLGLTEVKPHREFPDRDMCEFRLSEKYYAVIFGADLVLFYFTPLLAAIVIYVRIDLTLKKREAEIGVSISTSDDCRLTRSSTIRRENEGKALLANPTGHASNRTESTAKQRSQIRARIQVVRMLFATVLVFAIAWLPFRGLLMYNTFAAKPWYDEWYSLFAKTLIYLNSAINPVLYNIMSARFRRAFYQIISFKKIRRSSKKANGAKETRSASAGYL